jgi:transmembrane sensor
MQDPDALFQDWMDGTLSGPEIDTLLDQIGEPDSPWPRFIDQALRDHNIAGLGVAEQRERLFRQIIERRDKPMAAPGLLRFVNFRKAAAAILILLAAGSTLFLLTRPKEAPAISAAQYKNDVAPGHSGAVLHLSNGSTIILDSAQNGTIARQGGVEAIKTNGELRYTGKTTQVVYNIISTDRGRQWRLTLPDGTKVWLNAASSIHYPITFTGQERIVEITGEAYFEVVHNGKQPFKVIAGGQTIRDIGTAFNINAYTDEPAIKTTLVEGAASVNGILLRPGQQAAIINDRVELSAANIPQVLAWKNGFFGFDHADIHTVMRQLSRWYDVDVKFEGIPDSAPFQGKIGRDLSLAQVLKILEQVHVHFRIQEDKRIIILP